MSSELSGQSPSQRISVAVNDLLQASCSEKALGVAEKIGTEVDTRSTAPETPTWIVSTATSDVHQPEPWTSEYERPGRTGILRTYTAGRVTEARTVSDTLTGIRYSHKDNIGVTGYPITAGNPSLSDRRSAVTSPLLSAVESAGGTLVGANHMGEFAMSPTGHSQWLGDGVNPLNDAYLSGGSSSGSAIAVARGACDVSFGTDTGGSVRLPACFCGLFGYKPTNGLFSHTGLIPLSETLDTIGLISRELEHLRATSEVLFDDETVVNPDLRRRLEENRKEESTAVAHLSAGAVARKSDESVARAYEAALRTLGRADVPGIEIDYSELEHRSVVVVSVEAARNVGRVLRWNWNLLGDQVLSRVLRGTAVMAIEYADAIHEQATSIRSFVEEYLANSRFLLMPTAPIVAPKMAHVEDQASESIRREYMRASEFTRFTNYLGLPAVTLPLPSETDALVPALQIVGRSFDDRALLDFAKLVAENIRD